MSDPLLSFYEYTRCPVCRNSLERYIWQGRVYGEILRFCEREGCHEPVNGRTTIPHLHHSCVACSYEYLTYTAAESDAMNPPKQAGWLKWKGRE